MFDLCKILGVEEGEVFKLNGCRYKIMGNRMYHPNPFQTQLREEWILVHYPLNLLAEAEIERMPFVPKHGQEYWSPAISITGEVVSVWNRNVYNGDDLFAIKLNIAFKTKEDCDKLGVPLMEQWKKELGW